MKDKCPACGNEYELKDLRLLVIGLYSQKPRNYKICKKCYERIKGEENDI